jgi:hypothetical protein
MKKGLKIPVLKGADRRSAPAAANIFDTYPDEESSSLNTTKLSY